ncbi:MAG: glycosyltransferase family 39 protein, partial [Anaerolineae bacterium]
WYGLQTVVGLAPPSPLETAGYALADRVAVGVLPLALVVALGIVWGWHLLRRLFGGQVAWVAALLWALDPFFLANAKVLHLDATLSTLMVLSALWMLIYLQERRARQLIISATLGGLAILTKVSALFLIPFWGLCLLVDHFSSLQAPISSLEPLVSGLRARVRDLLLWPLVAAVTCFALWPSLWVQLAASLDLVIRQGILLHTGGPKDQPLFYRGALGVYDPGPRFYLDVILHRTTFLTLPFSALGLLSLRPDKQEGRRGKPGERPSALLLTGFAGFYLLQMSLGGWKDSRYLLPTILALDVLAARGIVRCVHRLLVRASGRIAIVAGLIVAQACVALPRHPHYGTHYNELLGGPATASRVFPLAEFGEGLDLAGQYVDHQQDAEKAIVGTQFLANEMVAQHVRAPVYDVAGVGDDVDYLIFGVQYTTRGLDYPRWGGLWEETYKFREPAFVAAFGGIPYAWVHRPNADPVVPEDIDAQLGETIRLVGYRLAEHEVAPGDTLLLTLYWQAEAPVEEAYTVFTHLQGPDGELIAQQDNPPGRGNRPTDGWEPGVLVQDPYEIEVPLDAAFGEYTLSMGMYDLATLERLFAFDGHGEALPGDRIPLATVEVQPPVPYWRWVLSAIWLAAIFAGMLWPNLAGRIGPDCGSSPT